MNATRGKHSLLIIAVAVVAIVAVTAWLIAGPAGRRSSAPASSQATARDEGEARPGARGAGAGRELPPAQPPSAEPHGAREAQPQKEGSAVDDSASESSDDAEASAWAKVDLEQVRKAMPDNLYFKMSAPTKDEAVLQQREEERDRWNVDYGKVLSGTGTEEEVRAYYDLRARLATDYVEFATYLLDHYGDDLPDRDVEMLQLARRMNLARLEEIPRKVEEAMERKRKQDEARAAWLADQRDFDAGGAEESD